MQVKTKTDSRRIASLLMREQARLQAREAKLDQDTLQVQVLHFALESVLVGGWLDHYR